MNAPASSLPIVLPPQVWRGRELAQAQERTVSTGHEALDAQLPGKGWPLGQLIEVLQAESQRHVWQLVGKGLATLMAAQAEPAVLVDAPYQPFGPALRAQGITPEQLLCVWAGKPSARLWAAEQALRCGDVCAVLAWLPQARQEELRRLQLLAQSSEKLLVVFRSVAARSLSSPARVRLLVQGTDRMEVLILKRRGPPLQQPLLLPSQPRKLSSLLAARKERRNGVVPVPTTGSHVLDRTETVAG